MVSALLSYMLISGVFGMRNLYRIDVGIRLPEEIFSGKPVPLIVEIVNKSNYLPAFLIDVRVDGRDLLFPYIHPKSKSSKQLDLSFEERGLHRIKSIIASSVFPFNYFTRYRTVFKTIEFVVLPEPRKCAWVDQYNRRRQLRGDEQSNLVGFDSDILSIRDYIPGDPLRYISWKSTAKTGKLKTKEFASLENRSITIDFDGMDKKQLEFKISCVTHVILKSIRSNIPVGLVISGRTYKPNVSNAHKLSMLKGLALYGKD